MAGIDSREKNDLCQGDEGCSPFYEAFSLCSMGLLARTCTRASSFALRVRTHQSSMDEMHFDSRIFHVDGDDDQALRTAGVIFHAFESFDLLCR